MPLLVTKQSYDAREQKLVDLKSRKRAATEQKQIAHSQGDLRENAGFAEAKREIALVNKRLGELDLERADLQIIDPLSWCKMDPTDGNAQVGAMVSIRRGNSPKEEVFLIGGAWDGDVEQHPNNPTILPYTSPLAKLLIPHDVGFKGVLETSGDTITLVSARPPTPDEIQAIYQATPIQQKASGKSPKKKEDDMVM